MRCSQQGMEFIMEIIGVEWCMYDARIGAM